MQNHSYKADSGILVKQGGSASLPSNPVQAASQGCVAGVDIGGTNLRIAIADLTGRILGRSATSTVGIRSADDVVEMIRGGVRQLLAERALPPDALKAIAAGAPGVTNADSGVVIVTSYLMGWRDVPLRAMLQQALGLPAAVDNDVNMAAIGESWAGAAKDARDFVFLGIGTGIGAGIVLNRALVRGAEWSAGEVGYMLVPGVPETRPEPGKPGTLEEMIGGAGIREQWRLLCANEQIPPENLTATEIFDRAIAGDALAQKLLGEASRLLFYTIYNMSLVLNCPLFVLGGGVGMHPALCNGVNERMKQWGVSGKTKVTRSTLGPDAQLMGTLRLALDTAEASRR